MLYAIIFALALGADQLVKWWAVAKLSKVPTIPIIQNFFHLTYAENKGAAFSILSGARWFFVAIALVFIVLMSVLLKKNYFTTWWSKLGVALVSAGALGNALDRMRYGHVVDLFDFRAINFAIFNVADVMITVGGILLAVYLLFVEGKHGKKL